MSNKPIVLASGSKARHEMLTKAGVDFKTHPADIDEYGLIDDLVSKNTSFDEVAMTLSKEKALAISNDYKDQYVIGSDQLLIFDNKVFSKSENLDDAKEKLKTLSGQTHQLISGVAVILNGEVLWSYADTVDLKMHALNDDEISDYVENNQDICLSCVGGYAIEGAGIKLFERASGDFFTIMGMPLLPLLNYFRQEGVL